MDKNVSAWDRGLLWATEYAEKKGGQKAASLLPQKNDERAFVWFIELDVWLADGLALPDLIRHYESSPCDLIASGVLSHGPGFGDDWYWWGDYRIFGARGASGDLLLPRNNSGRVAPLFATFNVLSRLSLRLLRDVAAMAEREKRLVLHEALLPSLVRARESEGWCLSWISVPWVNIRWRPEFSLREAKTGKNERGWRIIHPVKENWTISGV